MNRAPLPVSILLWLLCALLGCGGGGGGGGGGETPAGPYAVSGQLTLNGEGFPGAEVSLSGAAERSATTDAEGRFSFTGLPDGGYSVATAVAGQRVIPAARTVELAGASVAAADFALMTHELRGSVVQAGQGCPGARVTLRQAGSPPRTATTSWGGDYAFSGLLNGSYTLEVEVDGQTASPSFTNPVAVDGVSRSGLDWLVDTHALTGRVVLGGGDWTGGGMAVLTGDAFLVAELDEAGRYAFQGLPNGSYSVAAHVPGQAVEPASRTVALAGADGAAEPFALVTHSLSGRVLDSGVGRAGVGLTLGGPVSASAVTGPDGAYSFPGLVNGTYAVTPASGGAVFDPPDRGGLVVLDGDSAGNDFTVSYSAPGVTTGGAGDVTAAGAVLKAFVNPGGSATAAWFEWGTDPSLEYWNQTGQTYVGSGNAATPTSFALDGLSPGAVYYYRAAARNREGTSKGAIASFSTDPPDRALVVVDTLADAVPPPEGATTLRAALDQVAPGGKIVFDPSLAGGTIDLGVVGEEHCILKGETFDGMRFREFAERDYGKSALYAAKDVEIDASGLPGGITLRWAGGDGRRARVLAVYGDLTLRNVTVTGGHSAAEALPGDPQGFTLARGGGVAVWGVATLENCTLAGNRVSGDESPSRDRGAFGGGLYANTVVLRDTVVSGNAVIGYGAAGGGLYSVGGADIYRESSLTGCAVTGNRVTGQHAYGGGVYSDGGGPGNLLTLELKNCTIARNLVEDHPLLPQTGQYYYRGGGVYMSNGYLAATGCTIVENAVTGNPAVFSGKPNMGGGGVAATIGNAHVVEHMELRHSIVAGNTVNGAAGDVYTGSLLHFYSFGYNLIGTLDFSQMLVPVPAWMCLNRRHWPARGDREGVALADVLSLPGVARHDTVRSAGTDSGDLAVLWYPPAGEALDRVPADPYEIHALHAGYEVAEGGTDDFLVRVLGELDAGYADLLGNGFGATFRADFEAKVGRPLDTVVWYNSPTTWPSDPANGPWIRFWRELDTALDGRLGDVGLGDAFWGTFDGGALGDDLRLTVESWSYGPFPPNGSDQLGRPRPFGPRGDAGAVEAEGPP